MINLETSSVYRKVGQNYQNILTEHGKHPDSYVTGVFKPGTQNEAGNISQLRNKITELAKEGHNITYDKTLDYLYATEEHTINYLA